ncbi:MAG: hypothetical protein JO353_04540 [Phycisphaerae bacterium]|nr:hypothetical protein [Phycisphaerae bacterium]
MLAVFTTTSSAAVLMLRGQIDGIHTQLGKTGLIFANLTLWNAVLQASLIILMLACTMIVLAGCAAKIWAVTDGLRAKPVELEPAMS